MRKPTLPIGWKINASFVKKRIIQRFFVDVFELSDGNFAYVFTRPREECNDYSITQTISISGNNYPFAIYNTHSEELLLKRAKRFDPMFGFNAIAGMKELKILLYQEVIHPLLELEIYEEYGVGIPNGILFFGPPGCGKTFIANRLAEEVLLPLIEIRGANVGSPYIHSTSVNIAAAFKKAIDIAPSIVFIDELSALTPRRDNLASGEMYREEEVNEFLLNLERASEKKVLVIGATNFPLRIDPAILRSGRMDRKIFIPPPDVVARESLFKLLLERKPVCSGINYKELGLMTEGDVMSDIRTVVEICLRSAARLKSKIHMTDIINTIKKQPPSVSSSDMELYFELSGCVAKEKKIGF